MTGETVESLAREWGLTVLPTIATDDWSPEEVAEAVLMQPFLIPASLTVAIEAAMEAMRSPMFPRVTITFAARELLM